MTDDLLRKRLRPLKITLPPIRWLRHLIPLFLIGVGVHILLPQLSDLRDALHTVEKMPHWLVFLALTAQIGVFGGNGYLLSSLAALFEERLAVVRGMLIILASNSLGLVAGMVGSSAAAYRWASASGVSGQVAALCGMLPILLNDLLLALISVVGLLHLLFIHQLTRLQAISFGSVLAVLGLLLSVSVWGMTHPDWLLSMLNWFGKRVAKLLKRPYAADSIENLVNELVDTWLIMRSGGWRGPVLGASLAVIFDMLTLYFLFVAAGYPINPGILLAGYGLPLLIGRVSFFPGGVGITEATMTAIYASLGIPGSVIVVVILGYRLISFWSPMLLGAPTAFYLQQVANDSHMSASAG
ncbi:MAG: YbhN family protein [Candidatus Promineifilaceae bacterium]